MHRQVDVEDVKKIALNAGRRALEIYEREFKIEHKADSSPLTEADTESNRIILDGLNARYPDIPILSEESGNADYEARRNWNRLWLVDPLDGTREFVSGRGEFTVNIALVEGCRPALGVVYAPAKDVLYYASSGRGAWRVDAGGEARLPSPRCRADGEYVVAASRSHMNRETREFIKLKRREHEKLRLVSAGSSLKICLVAEGTADCYPRLAPTMEWDTAAAHAVASEAGKKILEYGTDKELAYNKMDLHNPPFTVE